MNRVTILTTNAEAAHYAPLSRGDTIVSFARLPAEGPTGLAEAPAWAFVDWVLESCSGLEMCRRMRADPRTRDTHVTIVLDEDSPEDRRRALKAGADDYLIGPLHRQVMLDRVLALHSADSRPPLGQLLDRGDLHINVAGEQARWKGRMLSLRPTEFRVLRFLAENPNRVLSRQELVNALGKSGDPEYLRTVDVWIKRLRSGLRAAGGGQALRTVRGKGYVLDLV